MLKKILIVLIGFAAVLPLHAQQPDTARLFNEMRKLQTAYTSSGLTYDFRYTYASANRPERILDSLSGKMEMAAVGSRMAMNNLEFISNERFAIVLFRQDKVMYLYKPNAATPQDPLHQLRTLVGSGMVSNVEVTQTDRNKRVTIDFDSLADVRRIEMNIQVSGGLLTSVRYILRTEMMKGGGQALTEEEREKFGPLAVVSMYFLRYGMLPADRAPLHEQSYFTIVNGEYKPTAAYKEYEIYKGSPNL